MQLRPKNTVGSHKVSAKWLVLLNTLKAKNLAPGSSWALMDENKSGSRASCAEHPSRSWEYARTLMEGQQGLGGQDFSVPGEHLNYPKYCTVWDSFCSLSLAVSSRIFEMFLAKILSNWLISMNYFCFQLPTTLSFWHVFNNKLLNTLKSSAEPTG